VPPGPDDQTDDVGYSTPPPPDDRLWRHPSELRFLGLAPQERRWSPLAIAFLASVAGALATLVVLALI
jgi:hypothetical protein